METMITVGDGVSMPNNTIKLYNVPGQDIIFRNFRGRSTPVTREGDRSFCLIVAGLIRDQLAARGCNIKTLNDGTEFVNVAVRITPAPEENADNIWTMLDRGHIDQADLEFHFYEYNINGKKRTKIYLINADFHVKTFNNEYIAKDTYSIGIHWPGHIICTIDNENNTEDTTGDFAAIKQVIFNDPATIVVWWDDTKTVVKCQKGDTFDKEKGLAMAICKRLYGNESNFNNVIKKWTEPKEKKVEKEPENKPNRTRNGYRGKDIAPRKPKASVEIKSTGKMIAVTDGYIRCVRIKMAKRGWNYKQVANAAGIGKSTINRYVSTKKVKSRPSRMRRDIFEKINKALGIRWKE